MYVLFTEHTSRHISQCEYCTVLSRTFANDFTTCLSRQFLDTITEGGIRALIGDAAHAFSGNAGADAGFALENVYTSNRCIAWGNDDNQLLVKVLQLFDRFGSYHYRRLDDNLNKHFAIALDV